MNSIRIAFLFAVALSLSSGACATQYNTPSNVLWYAGGGTVTSATTYVPKAKEGEACATSYAGIWASGDASIRAAMEEGKIERVHSVDHKVESVMGVIAKVCTIVRGSR